MNLLHAYLGYRLEYEDDFQNVSYVYDSIL